MGNINLKQNEAQNACAKSTHKGVNWCLKCKCNNKHKYNNKDLFLTSSSLRIYLWWSLCALC